MPSPHNSIVAVAALTAAVLAACAPPTSTASAPRQTPAQAPTPAPSPTRTMASSSTATAIMRDAAGAQIGTITLTDSYAGVLLSGTVTGLGLGTHGIHVHEIGACVAPFTTAGGHFNPAKHRHGFKNPEGQHAGDLPNIETPAAGPLKFDLLLSGVSLQGAGGLLDADGAAVVIHASGDDYTTDPSGNSGGRIACGVIVAR